MANNEQREKLKGPLKLVKEFSSSALVDSDPSSSHPTRSTAAAPTIHFERPSVQDQRGRTSPSPSHNQFPKLNLLMASFSSYHVRFKCYSRALPGHGRLGNPPETTSRRSSQVIERKIKSELYLKSSANLIICVPFCNGTFHQFIQLIRHQDITVVQGLRAHVWI